MVSQIDGKVQGGMTNRVGGAGRLWAPSASQMASICAGIKPSERGGFMASRQPLFYRRIREGVPIGCSGLCVNLEFLGIERQWLYSAASRVDHGFDSGLLQQISENPRHHRILGGEIYA